MLDSNPSSGSSNGSLNSDKFHELIIKKLKNSSRQTNQPKMTPHKSKELYNRLMSFNNKKGEKLTQMKMEKLREDSRVFTHTPKINGRSKDTNPKAKDLVERMDEILDERQKKLRKRKMDKVRKKEMEIRMNCTFTPEINKKKVSKSRSKMR